jgi:tryptophan-rich sensory protein
MSVSSAILISLGICVISAVLEGVFAGKNVKSFFAKLQFPSYSAPLRVWYIIGVVYYVICFFILYRIFRYDGDGSIKYVALTLLLVMMGVNAFWNYVFFRAQNLFLSFFAFAFYPFIAIALFICLLQFDEMAAWSIVPYFVYLIYAVRWGYRLWKLNPNLR